MKILAKLHNFEYEGSLSNGLCTDTTWGVCLTLRLFLELNCRTSYVVDRQTCDKMLHICKTAFKIFALIYYFPRKDNLLNNVRILDVPEM